MFLELFGMQFDYKEKDGENKNKIQRSGYFDGEKQKRSVCGTQSVPKVGQCGGNLMHTHFVVTLCIFNTPYPHFSIYQY